MDIEEIIQPLTAHDVGGRTFTLREAAEAMAEPGLPADFLLTQLRTNVQRRYVQVRGSRGVGRTAHNLLKLPDLVVAKALSVLVSDASISDVGMLQELSLRFYSWRKGELETWRKSHPKAGAVPDPVTAAITGEESGEYWVARLDVLRSDQSGEREIRAYVFNMDAGMPERDQIASEYQPRSTITFHITPQIKSISARLSGPKGH